MEQEGGTAWGVWSWVKARGMEGEPMKGRGVCLWDRLGSVSPWGLALFPPQGRGKAHGEPGAAAQDMAENRAMGSNFSLSREHLEKPFRVFCSLSIQRGQTGAL